MGLSGRGNPGGETFAGRGRLRAGEPAGRTWLRLLLGVAVAIVWSPGTAWAALDVFPPDDPSGMGFRAEVSDTQAGAHPEGTTSFDVTFAPTFVQFAQKGGVLRNTVVDLPPGVVGNPRAVERCPMAQLAQGNSNDDNCPAASQVGVVELRGRVVEFGGTPSRYALYAMVPSEDQLATFAFKSVNAVVTIEATVRPEDNGVRLTVRNAAQSLIITGSTVEIWGVPGDPSHDSQRCPRLNDATGVCDAPRPNPGVRRAFFSNPTACDEPKATSIRVSSWWVDPIDVLSSTVTDVQPIPTGCDRLSFEPTMSVRPTASAPDSPTGLSVDLALANDDEPQGLATAHLRDVEVSLPEGVSISPSSATGLDACTDAQLAAGTDRPVRCPDASKVGVATAESPVLDRPLTGSVYVGSQRSRVSESGEMFRIFLVLEGPAGLKVKLIGHVRADDETGQLVSIFADNPQLPVSKIHLQLTSSSTAPLATPPTCGVKGVSTMLSSWGGQISPLTDRFAISCPGMRGFSPTFAAGMKAATSGAYSPLVVRIERADRQEFLDGVSLSMPTGLLAKLKGVSLCSNSDAATGTCPPTTMVGTATVGTGPGPTPLFLRGSVSLTGPYKGAPYGLAVAVPAIAGPFDLGVVVVRQAVFIDRDDAHITVLSDSLPTIVGGVPVRLRSIDATIDRTMFTLNPTSCAEKHIRGTMHSQQGSFATSSARFQVGDCGALPFKPKLALRLRGKKQTGLGKHPGLTAKLSKRAGEAGIRNVEVRLPLSLALDPDNANGLCEFEEGRKAEPRCPKSSIIGRAQAVTPLLDKPLKGNVYFVKNVRRDPRTGRPIRTLPALLAALRGEVALNLRATTSVKDGRLVNTFSTVPDAPVSSFNMSLRGGKGGILVVTGNRSLCRRGTQFARSVMKAHNGKRADTDVRLATPCTKKNSRKDK
jgi:hypothetical protein